ncbi:MAG: DUF2723 domain-containing protein [Planctomycetes bacterium]|nr:DUF2723 domain-containing protein [Planctomycetota bacterium]
MPTGERTTPHSPAFSLTRRRHASPFALGAVWTLATLLLYAATGAPGVQWQDSGIHQYRIVSGVLENPYGLALSHPLHYWLGRAALHFPFGSAPQRLNLLSAVAGAVTVGLVAGVVAALTRRRAAACLAAVALALAHSFWQMSAVTETYTLAAALLALEWCLLLAYVRTRAPLLLVAVFAVNGLHVADHLLGLLTLVTYVGLAIERVARGKLAPRWLLVAVLAWLVTTTPYTTLIWSHYRHTGELGATLSSALFGGQGGSGGYAGDVFNLKLSWGKLCLATLTLGYSFPSLALPIALGGLLRPARGRVRIFRRVLIAQTIIIVGFVFRYSIVDLYTFFVPVCVVVALWFGVGVDRLLGKPGRQPARGWVGVVLVASALLPLVVYWYFPTAARTRGWLHSTMRDIAFRDEYAFFFRPWKHGDHSGEEMADAVLREAGADGVFISDGTIAYTVATRFLTLVDPPATQVYCRRRCLTDPARPPLTTDELRDYLRSGRVVLTTPWKWIEKRWGPDFVIDQADPFWCLGLPPSAGAPVP